MKEVTVNGEVLPQLEIREYAANLRVEREQAEGPLSIEARMALQDEALQLLVARLLIVQEARRLSLAATDAEVHKVLQTWAKRYDGVAGCRAGADNAEAREDIQRRLLIDKVLDRWRSSARRPKLSEVRTYYNSHNEEFNAPEMIHASHIVRHFEGAASEEAVREQVREMRVRVAAGEAFGEVSRQHSECPENEGDLGWFARGLMVGEFDDQVFAAEVGTLTQVFRTAFGFHFAFVHGRRPAGISSFEEVRLELEGRLWLASQEREVTRSLAALQAKAVIRRMS